jgi:hypothetical protein
MDSLNHLILVIVHRISISLCFYETKVKIYLIYHLLSLYENKYTKNTNWIVEINQ